MNTILKALFGWLFSFAGKWLDKRRQDKDNAAVTANRDAALKDAQAQRDNTESALEASHVETDAALRDLFRDSAARGPDVLRRQSTDVQRAIDGTNDSVR